MEEATFKINADELRAKIARLDEILLKKFEDIKNDKLSQKAIIEDEMKTLRKSKLNDLASNVKALKASAKRDHRNAINKLNVVLRHVEATTEADEVIAHLKVSV